MNDFLVCSVEAFEGIFITNPIGQSGATSSDNMLIIKPEYSSDLDYYQDIYSNISSLLNQEAMIFCQDLAKNNLSERHDYIMSLVDNFCITCVYFPHLGFLLNIKSNGETNISFCEDSLDLIASFLELDIVFISINSGVFCKSLRMKHLDDVYGDIHSKIKDIELDICHHFITHHLTMKERRIFYRIWCDLSEIDAIISLCISIDKFNLTRPTLTLDTTVHVEGGRFAFHFHDQGISLLKTCPPQLSSAIISKAIRNVACLLLSPALMPRENRYI